MARCVKLKPVRNEPSIQKVRLFHFNDWHRRMKPLKDGTGGAEKLVGKIRQLESENPEAITLNIGDVAGDRTEHGPDTFQPVPQLFNRAGVDILALGNHEFEDSTDGYASLEKGLVEPFQGEVLCANVRHADGRPIAGVKPYTIRQLQNQSIAFVGVVTRHLTSSVFPAAGAALSVMPIEQTLKELVPKVRSQGVDAVVVLAHDNLNNVKKYAKQVPGVDLAFAAHDHRATESPVEVTRADGSKAWVAEADAYGRRVGQADLIFEDGDLARVEGQLHTVGPDSPADPETARIVKDYRPGPTVTTPRERVRPKTQTLGSFSELAKHFANEENPKS